MLTFQLDFEWDHVEDFLSNHPSETCCVDLTSAFPLRQIELHIRNKNLFPTGFLIFLTSSLANFRGEILTRKYQNFSEKQILLIIYIKIDNKLLL